MKKVLGLAAIIISASLLTSCIVKPPGGNPDDLGPAVSADDINAAIEDATDVPQSKAYHVGDYGTVQLIQSSLGMSAVNQTYQFQVQSIDTKNITYTRFYVEGGVTETGTIAVTPSTTAPLVMKFVKKAFKTIARFFKKIEIENTRAIGGEKPIPKSISHKVHYYQSPSEMISSVHTADDTYTSQYFGLSVTKHKYTTQNCSQIPGCIVNAVKVEYYEVRTFTDGHVEKIRVLRDLTKEVPGLFLMLDLCESKTIVDGDNQLPLTTCLHVSSFMFGSN